MPENLEHEEKVISTSTRQYNQSQQLLTKLETLDVCHPHIRYKVQENKDFTYNPWGGMVQHYMEGMQMSSAYPEVPLHNHHCLSPNYILDGLTKNKSLIHDQKDHNS